MGVSYTPNLDSVENVSTSFQKNLSSGLLTLERHEAKLNEIRDEIETMDTSDTSTVKCQESLLQAVGGLMDGLEELVDGTNRALDLQSEQILALQAAVQGTVPIIASKRKKVMYRLQQDVITACPAPRPRAAYTVFSERDPAFVAVESADRLSVIGAERKPAPKK
eukprot:506410_1